MAERKKILICDRFAADCLLSLKTQAFLEIELCEGANLPQKDLSPYHGMIIRSRTVVDRNFLKRAPRLQVIVSATSGFDHIDLDATQDLGVTVMNTPSANTQSAAELTWALLLSCARHIGVGQKMVKSGQWDRSLITGMELQNRTLGIVGLGRIGQRVAQIANAFKMEVIAYDPYVDEQAFLQSAAERVAFEELLKRAEAISFHVPKTRETQKMLHRGHFEYIHRGVILINTSRGSVIDENDLADALEHGWVGAAGLDVFDKEPLGRQSRLLQFPQCCLTPHIGANTEAAFQLASDQAAEKICKFFIDGSTSDVLPPKEAWYGAVPAFSAE